MRLAAVAEVSVIAHANGWERLAIERDRLLRLRDLAAPGTAGRAAQRVISAILESYQSREWDEDNRAGMYAGSDPIRALCFAITKLSKGRLSPRKLQEIFAGRG